MALIDCDSFDGYVTAGKATRGWANYGGGGAGGFQINTSTGRNGTSGAYSVDWDEAGVKTLAATVSTTAIIAFAFLCTARPTGTYFFRAHSSGTQRFGLLVSSTGAITFYVNGSAVGSATAAGQIVANVYNHFELSSAHGR